jgi:hypothetical protein
MGEKMAYSEEKALKTGWHWAINRSCNMLACICAGGFILMLSACTQLTAPGMPPPPVIMSNLSADQYLQEIKKLENAVLKESSPTRRAKTYYRLARLWAGCSNPRKSYVISYRYLLKSAESDPSLTASN